MRTMILGLLILMLALAGVVGTQAEPTKKKKPAAVDRYGDALPEGAIGRLGTVRFRHGRGASQVEYAAGGKILASAGADMGVCLWDAQSGRLLHQLKRDPFSEAVAVSPDGTRIFTGLAVVDVATGKEVVKIDAPASQRKIAFAADSTMMASARFVRPGNITLRDCKTGKEIRHTDRQGSDEYITSIAFSPADSKIIASATDKNHVRTWDTSTGKLIHQFEGHSKPVYSVAISRDGQTLASGGEDGAIRLWDVKTGKPIGKIETGHWAISTLAFSPDGRWLASTGSGGTVILWDAQTRKKVRRWETGSAFRESLAFAPNSKTVATSDGCAIRQWNTETGKEINALDCHHGAVASLAFAQDGKRLFSAGYDGKALEWDLGLRESTGRLSRRIAAQSFSGNSAISMDGTMLARTTYKYSQDEGYTRDPVIYLSDTVSGKERHALKAHKEQVRAMKFSPNGKVLASSGREGGIRIWDAASGRELHHIAEKTEMYLLAFSANGQVMISAGLDSSITCWELDSRKPLIRSKIEGDDIFGIACSPDGRCIAATGRAEVYVWAAETGKKLIRTASHVRLSRALAFSPSGRVLATGGIAQRQDNRFEIYGAVQLFEVRTGQEIRQINENQTDIRSLAFAPDGRTLASGGSDSTILLWDLTGHADAKPAPPTAKQLDGLWSDLAADAKKADRAHWTLALSPQQSLPFLKERLRPAPAADAALVARMLVDLESANINVRQKAEGDLVALGESAELALRKYLGNRPTLELHRRVEQILLKREPDALRQLRAIDTLREIATPQASGVLEALAKTATHPRVAQSAAAALAPP
jgi:WD40 repeat protein